MWIAYSTSCKNLLSLSDSAFFCMSIIIAIPITAEMWIDARGYISDRYIEIIL